jgi:DNA-binding response OmpR family regulator
MTVNFEPILKSKRVIIVDDDKILANMLSHICKSFLGAEDVLITASFLAGQNIIARDGETSLLIIDLALDPNNSEDMSGLTLAELVRRSHDTPILFISGKGIDDEVLKTIRNIPHSTIEMKPFSMEVFYSAIKYLMVKP